jgi:hypothetical protein
MERRSEYDVADRLPPASQLIATVFGTSGNLTNIINRAKFHIDWLKGFGW